ncbi:MAG: GntR family transcriptional regulator [Desulfofustis sp.]|nr:GntR family transcriptional regulator [Desulfofustis sp.]
MPIPVKTKPFNRSFMREEVYNTVLGWIMDGELRPGEKLLDKELAESLGVSRTPVREALRRLEDKGLVESAANRWTRVSEVSIDEPEKIYPIIWTLEELAVTQAIEQMTGKDFTVMEQANNQLRKALAAENPVEASIADIEFHEVFIKKSENPHLASILHDLKISYRRVEVTYFEKDTSGKYSFDEHCGILEAFKKGDLQLSQAMIRLNWQNSLLRLQQLISKKIKA